MMVLHFFDGPSKPVTIAVPCLGEWEGLSIDRADLGQPGIKTTLNGKIHGDGPGFFLDPVLFKELLKNGASSASKTG